MVKHGSSSTVRSGLISRPTLDTDVPAALHTSKIAPGEPHPGPSNPISNDDEVRHASSGMASRRLHRPLKFSATSLIPFFSPSVLTLPRSPAPSCSCRGDKQIPHKTLGVSSGLLAFRVPPVH